MTKQPLHGVASGSRIPLIRRSEEYRGRFVGFRSGTINDSAIYNYLMSIPINLVGFSNPAISDAVEKHLSRLIDEYSFRLSSLEAVSIASDYNQFLANFDTGFRPLEAISATDGENAGMGMTPEVFRSGILGSHLILRQDIAFPLAHTAREDFYLDAVYTLTHESAHAEEHLIAAEDYGPQIISVHERPDFYLVFGRTCWGEYYASRRAAFSHPEMGATLTVMFVNPMNRFVSDLAKAAAAFKSTSDRQALSETVTHLCTNLFIHFSRLSGHYDGLSFGLPEQVASITAFSEHPRLFEHFSQLGALLRGAYGRAGKWGTLENGLQPIIGSFRGFFSFVTS